MLKKKKNKKIEPRAKHSKARTVAKPKIKAKTSAKVGAKKSVSAKPKTRVSANTKTVKPIKSTTKKKKASPAKVVQSNAKKTTKKKTQEVIYPRDEFQKNKVTGHPAHIEGYSPVSNRTEKKYKKKLGDFLFRGLTHKEDKTRKQIALKDNPNAKDKRPAFLSQKQYRQNVELFEKTEEYSKYRLSSKDKKTIEKLNKK